MSSTAHEDQFTSFRTPVERILAANVRDEHQHVHELQVRLAAAIERELVARTSLIEARKDIQTWIDSRNEWMARAEAAEAELAKARDQKPAATVTGKDVYMRGTISISGNVKKGDLLYAAPVPATASDDDMPLTCDTCGAECNNPWHYSKGNKRHLHACDGCYPAAVVVPAEWREVMAELASDLQAACDAEHPHRDQYPSVMRKYQNDMDIVEKARALLQSAEVIK